MLIKLVENSDKKKPVGRLVKPLLFLFTFDNSIPAANSNVSGLILMMSLNLLSFNLLSSFLQRLDNMKKTHRTGMSLMKAVKA